MMKVKTLKELPAKIKQRIIGSAVLLVLILFIIPLLWHSQSRSSSARQESEAVNVADATLSFHSDLQSKHYHYVNAQNLRKEAMALHEVKLSEESQARVEARVTERTHVPQFTQPFNDVIKKISIQPQDIQTEDISQSVPHANPAKAWQFRSSVPSLSLPRSRISISKTHVALDQNASQSSISSKTIPLNIEDASFPMAKKQTTAKNNDADKNNHVLYRKHHKNSIITKKTFKTPQQTLIHQRSKDNSGPFRIQMACFMNKANAIRYQHELSALGYKVEMKRRFIARHQKYLYQVLLGPISSRADAGRLMNELRGKNYLQGLLIKV